MLHGYEKSVHNDGRSVRPTALTDTKTPPGMSTLPHSSGCNLNEIILTQPYE